MATTPLILAALATSAVPDLTVTGASAYTNAGDGDFTAVLLSSDMGQLLVRVPTSDAAAAVQSAENLGLTALTGGARHELPFLVPEVLGVTRAGDQRAVVTTFLPGGKFNTADLTPDAILLASLGGALQALHALPHSVVQSAGLPCLTVADIRAVAARTVERAAATGSLPAAVKQRWLDTLTDTTLWDFAPLPIHGSLSDSDFLIAEDAVTGILGFSEFSVGDPARDFAWLCAAAPGVLEEVLRRYETAGGSPADPLLQRASFYHELELAKWLIHGFELHDREIIADAEKLLDSLVTRLRVSPQREARRIHPEVSVPELLDETSALAAAGATSSDTAAITADLSGLDDDRIFNADTDFIEPLPEDADGDNGNSH